MDSLTGGTFPLLDGVRSAAALRRDIVVGARSVIGKTDSARVGWPDTGGVSMSEPRVHGSVPRGVTLERSREDVLDAARPLPSDEDALIEGLTEDEDRQFLGVILDA